MNISFLRSSLLEGIQHSTVLPLRDGSIVKGTIQKFFKGDIALVSVNGQSIVAKLERSLSVLRPYYFEIDIKDDLPSLKVVGEESEDKNMQNILQALGARGKKEESLASFLLSKSIPFSKEFLTTIAKETSPSFPSPEKKAVETMIARNFTPSKSIFQALKSLGDASLAPLFNELTTLANLEGYGEELVKFKGAFRLTKGKEVLFLLVKGWLEGNIPFRILQQTGAIEKGVLEQQALVSLSPKREEAEEITAMKKTLLNNLPDIEKMPFFHQMVESIEKSPNLRGKLTQEGTSLFINEEGKEILTEVNKLLQTSFQSREFQRILSTLFSSLGLTYESELNGESSGAGLKGALLKMLEQPLPPFLRERAEEMVHKLTALQLLSSDEGQGPITSLYVQFPLYIREKLTEVSLQWKGKKREDGTIDPNYCHILFHLELSYLQEMVISARVQNRAIIIDIINEHQDIKPIMESLKPSLRLGLSELDYYLSDVKVFASKDKTSSLAQVSHSGYKGVDLKI
ncbi:hypothetical protein HPB58_05965 [Priestia filamentosa]|uniref:hypothetical protein n=1 Tax=Priestia filamentosa TaxID=1402861 RepID=UPI001FB50E30|nr:hypothetical protein [Priestia filamentosa]UOE61716.1 hypothetical protein HPB58_05965 [Priestia filamentosa]